MSTITNTPRKKLGDYSFDEIGTFSVDQLAGVEFDRQFSPVTNADKDLSAATWGNIPTTWATETRTWGDTLSDIVNMPIKNLGSYTIDELSGFSTDQIGGVEFTRQFSPFTNTQKPL